MLGSIQFSESRVLWAQGYTPPGGEAGAGEWTLVTSHDGGRSWRELRDSWSHNEGTRAFFFAHGRDGWIMAPNSLRLGAEPYYASTTDGRRWRTLRVPNSFVDEILYRGGGRGAALANDQYKGKSSFFVTEDNGRHWRLKAIGKDMWVDQFTYSDHEAPVLAGCRGHDTVILASRNGGKSWTRTKIPRLSSTPQTGGCDAQVDGLAFAPGKPGFALVQRHTFPLTKADGYASVWRTVDGGRDWQRVFLDRYPETAKWFDGPYVLGDLTLVFVKGGTSASVAYSRDAGQSWSTASLPTQLSGCFARGRALTCTAGSKGFRVATLTSKPVAGVR